jgi:hypothetical protein
VQEEEEEMQLVTAFPLDLLTDTESGEPYKTPNVE